MEKKTLFDFDEKYQIKTNFNSFEIKTHFCGKKKSEFGDSGIVDS